VQFARYALDGLASGSIIALMGLGVVVIYRSTRVLTFAQGALASLSAYIFFQMFAVWGWPVGIALVLAIVASAGAGIVSERLAINPLRRSDPMTRTIATLGLVLATQVLMRSIWGGSEQFLPPVVRGSITLGGETIGAQTVLIVVVTFGIAIGVAFWFRRSLTGLALSAMADEPTSARLLGVAPDKVSLLTWALAAALGAMAGILATPLLVLNPWQMTFIMVFSYAAALIGGFVSLPLTVAGGLLIGVVRSTVTGYVTVAGLSETLGYIAVFAVLLVSRGRGRHLVELLREGSDRSPTASIRSWPALLVGRIPSLSLPEWIRRRDAVLSRGDRIVLGASIGTAVMVVPALAGDFWTFVATLGVVYALLGMSLAILTGWSGQLNLHVAALGLGWGAYAAFALSTRGVSPMASVLAAGIVTVPFSILVGAVALRFRGLELAVATLALGLTFERLAFRNLGEWLTQRTEGTTPFQSSFVPMGRPRLGGLTLADDYSFYLFALGVATVLVIVAWNLSRHSTRRALVAIREREVAAEVAGIPTLRYRIFAFSGSIAVAATAGALFASLKLGITPDSFGLDLSFLILAAVVIGGMRSIAGGILGGLLAAFLPELVRFGPLRIFGGERLFLLFAVGLVLTLVFRPQGLIGPPSARRMTTGRAMQSRTALDGAATVVRTDQPPGHRAYRAPLDRHTGPAVIRANDVKVRFGGVQALAGVDLWIPEGEICALIGPNGAGKSTLFNCLSGVVTPDAGRVYLHGDDITDMPPHRRAARGLGRTFQTVEAFGGLTILENLMLGGHLLRRVGAVAEGLGLPVARESERFLAEKARRILRTLDMEHLEDADPYELAFGHLRRLEIGLTLMRDPTMLLLDEPSAGLNPSESSELARLIGRLRDDRGLSVLLVEHDMDVVGEIAEWVYVLDFGEMIATGSPNQIRHDPLVVSRYLGDAVLHSVEEGAHAGR
jgi:ABC-type branched-subunit amino acid transport system ATPase component/branched-subunit amino acid ABC-type transport system permease component